MNQPGFNEMSAKGFAAVAQMYIHKDMGVSKNRGLPKWLVYNAKPY